MSWVFIPILRKKGNCKKISMQNRREHDGVGERAQDLDLDDPVLLLSTSNLEQVHHLTFLNLFFHL
jgi:hypothetical protein